MEALISKGELRLSKCEACTGKINCMSTMRCLDCEQNLCEQCFQTHQNLKVSRSHRVVSLIEEGKDNTSATSRVIYMYCSKHVSEVLRFYCKHCELSICRDCKMTSHEGHKTVDIEDFANEHRTLLNISAERIEWEISLLKKDMEKIENHEKESIKDFEKFSTTVENRVREMQKALEETKNVLLEESKTRVRDCIQEMRKQKVPLQQTIDSLTLSASHIKHVIQNGSSADVIEISNNNESNIESIIERMRGQVPSLRLSKPTFTVKTINKLEPNWIGHSQQHGTIFNSQTAT